MLVDAHNLDLVFKGFKSVYTDAHIEAPSHYGEIAMTVPSGAASETYSWLGNIPQLREWIGPRIVHGLKAHGFTIVNRKFESTVEVLRDHISDDKIGIFKPMFAEMGSQAKRHPDELVFELLKAGFATTCHDGQNFFDTDHPLETPDGVVTVSNMQAGAGTPWYLLDTSRAIRPIIWQERESYEFQGLDKSSDENVFLNDRFLYGVRARVNAGFGLWQLAFGSKGTLDADNYAAARAAMLSFTADGGRKLGTMPTVMVVPPSLESAARKILNSEYGTGGVTNEW